MSARIFNLAEYKARARARGEERLRRGEISPQVEYTQNHRTLDF